MGLEGTLRAFSATDVFGLLLAQRKTGVLTVVGPKDSITISFLGGQIVKAESAVRSLDDRVGSLLVRGGMLPPERLRAALAEQKETRESLAVLLARQKAVPREALAQALRIQIIRIFLSAFRWTEGEFKFREDRIVSHDATLFDPIPTEAVLKDSSRWQREWSKLEAKVFSPDLVYRRVPGLEKLRLVQSPDEAGPGALVVSRPEAETWPSVDGSRAVKEILERAFLSDLDVYQGLSELVDRGLISEVGIRPETRAEPSVKKPRFSASAVGLWALLLVLAASAVRQIPRNPLNLFLRPAQERPEARELFKSVSLARLASVERAVRVYYDSSGQYPKGLQDLVESGVLTSEGASDPYGRPYRYILRPEEGKFRIYGRDAQGDIDLDLSFERSLAPVTEAHPDSSNRPETQPGVHVVK
jgi:hypothetical protein